MALSYVQLEFLKLSTLLKYHWNANKVLHAHDSNTSANTVLGSIISYAKPANRLG